MSLIISAKESWRQLDVSKLPREVARGWAATVEHKGIVKSLCGIVELKQGGKFMLTYLSAGARQATVEAFDDYASAHARATEVLNTLPLVLR